MKVVRWIESGLMQCGTHLKLVEINLHLLTCTHIYNVHYMYSQLHATIELHINYMTCLLGGKGWNV